MTGREIKIAQEPLRQALTRLNAAKQTLETSFTKDTGGKNQLLLSETLKDIKASYETVLHSYRTLLTVHVKETQAAIEQMEELDRALADQTRGEGGEGLKGGQNLLTPL